jgi:DNA primase
MEKLDFVEAVLFLAERYHLSVEDTSSSSSENPFDKKALLKVMKWAADWYQRQLFRPLGQCALEYVEKRGLSEEMIGRFVLGYAPPSWTALLEEAKRQNIALTLLEQVGLIKKSSKGQWIDLFTHRVMFPIWNVHGEMIAFGGRTLEKDEKNFKYINSPETPLFRKNQTLYGLNFAKDYTKQERSLTIVEGYTDVIFCHQAQVFTAVAPLGTSLTENHVKLAHRFADELFLLFDGDHAGIKAGERALSLLFENHFQGSILVLPEGQDPCDFIRKEGEVAFREKLKTAESLFDFKIRQVQKRHEDMKTPETLLKGLEELRTFVQTLSLPLVREIWTQEICNRFQINPQKFLGNSKTKKEKFPLKSASTVSRLNALHDSERFILRFSYFQPASLPAFFKKNP